MPLNTLFEGAAGRYLLQTPEVGEILARLSGRPLAEFANREELLTAIGTRFHTSAELTAERVAVEERLRRIQERFRQTPTGQRRQASPATELSREEKIWFNETVSRTLRLNPEWRPFPDNGQNLDFFSTTTADNLTGLRERFFRDAPDPAIADDGSSTPVAERPAAGNRVRRYLEQMRECVRRRQPNEMVRVNAKYMITQLVTDEAMTFGGAVIAAGGMDNVDWRTLPNDLLFEAMASIGDSLIASTPNLRLRVRWFRMQGFGVAQSSVDAVLYQISPMRDPGELPPSQRFAYNTAWNTLYAPLSMTVYDLVSGLECLNASNAIVIGAQLGIGLGANVAYFGMRNAIFGRPNATPSTHH